MKTSFRLKLTERFILLSQSIKFYVSYRLGIFFLNRIKLIEKLNEIKLNADYSKLSNSQKNNLSREESKLSESKTIHKIEKYRVSHDNLDNRFNPYSKICKSFVKLFSKDKSIKKVCNVGSRIDFVSDFLSKRFSKVKFISVDFQKNLKQQNKLLNAGKNWEFISGYIIDLLDKNFSADVITMSFTACKMTPKEFHNFIYKSRRIKYFIIIEPYFPYYLRKNKLRLNRPEEIPTDEIIIGSKEILNPNLPTYHYHHNYIVQLRKIGFKVIESKITPNENSIGGEHLMVFKKNNEK